MKALFCILFIVFFLNGNSQVDTSQLVDYSTDEYTIQYPTNWSLFDPKYPNSIPFVFVLTPKIKQTLSEKYISDIQCQKTSLYSLGKDTFNLEIYKKIKENSLKAYGEVVESQIVTSISGKYYKCIFTAKEGTITKDGKFVDGKFTTRKYELLSFISKSDNKTVYEIFFGTTANEFEIVKSLGEQILNSFILLK